MTKEKMTQIANELDKIQASENLGTGVDCVKTLIMFLRIGRWDSACAVAGNEWDKISSYTNIARIITEKNIFKPINFEELCKQIQE